jgi:predicted nucleic acid-binding Zn ribbon protein
MPFDKLMKNSSPALLLAMLVFNLIVLLSVIYVALDTRERGATKAVSTLWALGVGLFPPIIFIYFFMRLLTAARLGTPTLTAEPAKPEKNCPYCGGAVGGDEKLCRRCGRLL